MSHVFDATPLTASALQVSALAAVLAKAGARHAGEEAFGRDLAAGAPRNADGTVNLVHYAAWLAREANRGRD